MVIAYLLQSKTINNESVFKVVDLPGKGKGLVATRDIKVLLDKLKICILRMDSKVNCSSERNLCSLYPTKVSLSFSMQLIINMTMFHSYICSSAAHMEEGPKPHSCGQGGIYAFVKRG
jgi:hypothetical protein